MENIMGGAGYNLVKMSIMKGILKMVKKMDRVF